MVVCIRLILAHISVLQMLVMVIDMGLLVRELNTEAVYQPLIILVQLVHLIFM